MSTLGSLVESGDLWFSDGYRTKGSELSDSGFRIVRAGDVKGGGVALDGPDFVTADRSRAVGPRTVQPNDVILTTKGTVGRTAFVEKVSEPAVYSPQLCFFRPLSMRLDARFLYYWFSSPEFSHQASSEKSSTDMAPYLSLAQLAQMTISVPSTAEQIAIAEVLGALDDKIATNSRICDTLDALSSAVFAHRTSDSPLMPLSSLDVVSGGTPSRAVAEYWGDDVPWVSIRDLNSSTGAITTTVESLSTAGVYSCSATRVPTGSVILSARGTVGQVGRLTMEGTFNQSCYGFRPSSVPPAALFHAVRTAAQAATGIAHGSVFSTITRRSLQALLAPMPPTDELQRLELSLAPHHRVIDALTHESQTLASLRDTLLPALMDGRLRVRDAIKQAEEVL